jgi:hypothetical protein
MNETPETGPAATGIEDKAPGPAPVGAPERPLGEAPAELARPGRRGRRLLIILFVGSLAVAAGAAAVTGALLLHRSHWPPPAPRPLHATVFNLHPGQCFNSLPNGIAGAHAVPCRRPHDGEIYGGFRVAGHHWRGSAALASLARQGCQARLTGYLNPQLNSSGLAESYAYPNEGAWATGEHSVICEIRSTQGKLTGSVRASRP